jgi:hypothetical protein
LKTTDSRVPPVSGSRKGETAAAALGRLGPRGLCRWAGSGARKQADYEEKQAGDHWAAGLSGKFLSFFLFIFQNLFQIEIF